MPYKKISFIFFLSLLSFEAQAFIVPLRTMIGQSPGPLVLLNAEMLDLIFDPYRPTFGQPTNISQSSNPFIFNIETDLSARNDPNHYYKNTFQFMEISNFQRIIKLDYFNPHLFKDFRESTVVLPFYETIQFPAGEGFADYPPLRIGDFVGEFYHSLNSKSLIFDPEVNPPKVTVVVTLHIHQSPIYRMSYSVDLNLRAISDVETLSNPCWSES